jgi:hypothetical protein
VGVIVNAKAALPLSGNPRDATPPMSGKAKKGRNANCGVDRAGAEPEPEPEPELEPEPERSTETKRTRRASS